MIISTFCPKDRDINITMEYKNSSQILTQPTEVIYIIIKSLNQKKQLIKQSLSLPRDKLINTTN